MQKREARLLELCQGLGGGRELSAAHDPIGRKRLSNDRSHPDLNRPLGSCITYSNRS
jgi:hypothetical protein